MEDAATIIAKAISDGFEALATAAEEVVPAEVLVNIDNNEWRRAWDTQAEATGRVADALRATLISPNEADSNLEPANVVDGLFAIARALQSIATQIKWLGNGDAAGPMGAIEGHAAHLGEKLDRLGDMLNKE